MGASRASQNIREWESGCSWRGSPVGLVWSLERPGFFFWRSPAGDEQGATWPCCGGAELRWKTLASRRWKFMGPCLLLLLVAQEGAKIYPTHPKAKGEYAAQLLLLDRSIGTELQAEIPFGVLVSVSFGRTGA